MEQEEKNRKIVHKNWFNEGRHLYEDQLGWPQDAKEEAGSLVSREIFRYFVEILGLNLCFYYTEDECFYGIHAEDYPIKCKLLPCNEESEYPFWRCSHDTHEDCTVIASFDDEKDIWDNFIINGKKLEEVIEKSYIIGWY